MTYYYDCGNEEINIATTALIDRLTFNRITDKGFQNLTPFQQERITLAAKCQCNYIIEKQQNGEIGDVASMSVEDFSVSFNNEAEEKNKVVPYATSPTCYNLLVQTGLMARCL